MYNSFGAISPDLVDNGYYADILKKWNVSDGGIPSSAVLINNNATVGQPCVPAY